MNFRRSLDKLIQEYNDKEIEIKENEAWLKAYTQNSLLKAQ